jgi:phosphoribosylformimino-5-aminoimidazole carboxamide ribonucleotide (ProFAR) isomerase
MLLIPAIDLKQGHCVRLEQGDMDKVTTFSEDPGAMAKHWVDKGARRLHLVDLDGAFAGKPKNESAIKAILKAVGNDIPVQLGGGVRDLETIERLLDVCNASRYFSVVLLIISGGKWGAGGALAHGLPSTRKDSNQSRKNCLSNDGGFAPT